MLRCAEEEVVRERYVILHYLRSNVLFCSQPSPTSPPFPLAPLPGWRRVPLSNSKPYREGSWRRLRRPNRIGQFFLSCILNRSTYILTTIWGQRLNRFFFFDLIDQFFVAFLHISPRFSSTIRVLSYLFFLSFLLTSKRFPLAGIGWLWLKLLNISRIPSVGYRRTSHWFKPASNRNWNLSL